MEKLEDAHYTLTYLPYNGMYQRDNIHFDTMFAGLR